MSTLGGFDLVVEISNSALLKMIRSTKLGGLFLNPPFESQRTFDFNTFHGDIHFIFNDLVLDLTRDDHVVLTLSFYNSSIIGQSAATGSLVVATLDGTITVTARLSTAGNNPADASLMAPALDFVNATVDPIQFSHAAEQKIANAVAGTLVSADEVRLRIHDEVTNFFRDFKIQPLPFTFRVVGNVDGSLQTQPIQVERFEAHCISNPDHAAQGLGLYAILLKANDGNGDHAQKTALAVSAGDDSAVSISAEAFHKLIFCPSVANNLKVAISDLPTTCGNGKGKVSFNGFELASLADAFLLDLIVIEGKLTRSGFCYDATINLRGKVLLQIQFGQLVPRLQLDQPDVNVDTPWYCYLAGALFGGAEFGATFVSVDQLLQEVISSYSGSIRSLFSSQGLASPGAIGSIYINSVQVSPECLTISGTLPIKIPSPISPWIELAGSVMVTNATEIHTGVFDSTDCPIGHWKYQEQAQSELGHYTAIPHMMGRPLQLQWRLIGQDWTYVTLPDAANSQIQIVVLSSYPHSLPGGSSQNRQVTLNYLKSELSLQLTNNTTVGNNDGTYDFGLNVVATDPLGVICGDEVYVQMECDHIQFEPGYYPALMDCVRELVNRLRNSVTMTNVSIPPWAPVDHPTPDDLRQLIVSLLKAESTSADVALTLTKLAHGASYSRAVSLVGLSIENKSKPMLVRGIQA
jgi:hypothetical protein